MIFLTAAATKARSGTKARTMESRVSIPYSPLTHPTGFGQFSNQLPTIYQPTSKSGTAPIL
jgi:hypothetical protein